MGIRIKEIMRVFGLNQGEMAGVVGVTAAQMSRWILGQNEMAQPTAMAFQAALGVRWQWLLNGEGEMMLSERQRLRDQESELLDAFNQLPLSRQEFLVGYAKGMLAEEKSKK